MSQLLGGIDGPAIPKRFSRFLEIVAIISTSLAVDDDIRLPSRREDVFLPPPFTGGYVRPGPAVAD